MEGWRSLMILHHVSNSNDNSYFGNYNETKIQYQTQLRTLLYPAIKKFIKDHQLVEINDAFHKKLVGFIRAALIGIFKDTDVIENSYRVSITHNVILRKLNVTIHMQDQSKYEYIFEFSISI